jgi:hypothetical protein
MLLSVALLGAFHGLNPAMGWLFAVSLGLQRGARSGVLRALPPIALGHAASVAAVVAVVAASQRVVPHETLRWAGGIVLLAFALRLLLRLFTRRSTHPRWVGMRVGARDLALWSFLVSTAHGAGLMLVPVVLRLPPAAGDGSPHGHGALRPAGASAEAALASVAVHTAAMLAVMAAVALLVYQAAGVELLRRAWLNLDLVWAVALLVAAAVTIPW